MFPFSKCRFHVSFRGCKTHNFTTTFSCCCHDVKSTKKSPGGYCCLPSADGTSHDPKTSWSTQGDVSVVFHPNGWLKQVKRFQPEISCTYQNTWDKNWTIYEMTPQSKDPKIFLPNPSQPSPVLAISSSRVVPVQLPGNWRPKTFFCFNGCLETEPKMKVPKGAQIPTNFGGVNHCITWSVNHSWWVSSRRQELICSHFQ